jgi:hypothetical protein
MLPFPLSPISGLVALTSRFRLSYWNVRDRAVYADPEVVEACFGISFFAGKPSPKHIVLTEPSLKLSRAVLIAKAVLNCDATASCLRYTIRD